MAGNETQHTHIFLQGEIQSCYFFNMAAQLCIYFNSIYFVQINISRI